MTAHALAAVGPVDLVFRDALILDGSGSAPMRGDVAVQRGRIVAQGSLDELRAQAERSGGGGTLEDVFLQLTTPSA